MNSPSLILTRLIALKVRFDSLLLSRICKAPRVCDYMYVCESACHRPVAHCGGSAGTGRRYMYSSGPLLYKPSASIPDAFSVQLSLSFLYSTVPVRPQVSSYRYGWYQQDPLNSHSDAACAEGRCPVRRLNSLVAGCDGIETHAARCYRGGLSHTYLSARKWPGTVAIRAS